MIQLLGYAASLLIATSLLMRSIVRLRIINMAGAATFSLYGFLIGAYPVAFLNLMTTTINIVQLIRNANTRVKDRRVTVYIQFFEVTPEGEGSTIRQTAIFDPVGMPGLAYWYGVFPLHGAPLLFLYALFAATLTGGMRLAR